MIARILYLTALASSALATPPPPADPAVVHLLRAPRRQTRAFGNPHAPLGHIHLQARRDSANSTDAPAAGASISQPATSSPASPSPDPSASPATPPAPDSSALPPAEPASPDAPLPPGVPATPPSEPTTVTILNLELTVPVGMFQGGQAVKVTGGAGGDGGQGGVDEQGELVKLVKRGGNGAEVGGSKGGAVGTPGEGVKPGDEGAKPAGTADEDEQGGDGDNDEEDDWEEEGSEDDDGWEEDQGEQDDDDDDDNATPRRFLARAVGTANGGNPSIQTRKLPSAQTLSLPPPCPDGLRI